MTENPSDKIKKLRERLGQKTEPTTVFDPHFSKVEHTVTVTPHIFQDIVYLEISDKVYNCEGLEVDNADLIKNSRVNAWSYCVAKSFYDEMLAKHGRNPKWVTGLHEGDCLEPLSKEFIEGYKKGIGHHRQFDNLGINKTPALELLKAGEFDLFSYDKTGYNSNLYDRFNKVISRDVYLDEYCGFYSRRYNHADLIPHLESIGIRVERVEIPYYNYDEENGKYGLKLYYTPAPDDDVEKLFKLDTWEKAKYIVEKLGLDKFKFQKQDLPE